MSSAEEVVVTWEGEWGWLKRAVRSTRQALPFAVATPVHISQGSSVASGYQSTVQEINRTLAAVDVSIHERSLASSQFMTAHPYAVPAAVIACCSTTIFFRTVTGSSISGKARPASIALRNASAFAAASLFFVFPSEIQYVFSESIPNTIVATFQKPFDFLRGSPS